MTRLPAAPLFDATAYTANKPLHRHDCPYCKNDPALNSGCLKADELANRLGISRKTVTRYQRNGIPVQHADQLATRLGYNPICIWGFNWDDPEYATLVDN